jgi:hypothetical protein
MAASTVIKHYTDGSITLSDGTGTPVTLDVPFSTGDLSITGLAQQLREVVAYQTRGVLNSIRLGARTFPTISFTAQIADYSDATDTTAIDFFLKQAAFSGNVSVSDNATEVYTLDIVLTVEGTDHGDSADHVLTAKNVHCTIDVAEGEPNTLTVNGTVYGGMDGGVLSNAVTFS